MSSAGASDLKATKPISTRRLLVYVTIAVSAVLLTSVYQRIDKPEELDAADRILRRRQDWPLVSTARALVDIMADYSSAMASLQSGAPQSEHRATAVHRAAERLLEVAYDERTVFGLQYLASVLGHYRDHVISRQRSGRDEPVKFDSERLATTAQSIAELLAATEARRAAEGNQTAVDDQHPVSLSLHPEIGVMRAWRNFQNGITARHLYGVNDSNVGLLLRDMREEIIIQLIDPPAHWNGSQHKIIFQTRDGGKTIFRPDRWRSIDEDVSPDVFYFLDKERPEADVAAFHLDRILGFRRAPPVVFARINITEDIELSKGSEKFEFVRSPLGNECYSVDCKYYCGPMEPVCGVGRLLDGSFATLLPTEENGKVAKMVKLENPWKRTYSLVDHLAVWQNPQTSVGYCDKVRATPPFDIPSKLLDLIDLHIFDFLIGNMDRHHLYYYEVFGNKSAFIHMDNSKGFGKARKDELSILAPLYQCCQIRASTAKILLALATSPDGSRLSDRLRNALATDVSNPKLGAAHLAAIDRRVAVVLGLVNQCHILQQQVQRQRQQQQPQNEQQKKQHVVVVDDGL